jgi:hypothetical protein
MGLTKGQPGDLHQYVCKAFEQIASSSLCVGLSAVFWEAANFWEALRDEPGWVLQHAEQIKLGGVCCKCTIGERTAGRGTPHSTE